MDKTEKIINQLNDLLKRNYDAEADYKLAAEKVESLKLKEFLESRATNKYNFGHSLKEEIRGIGGEPDKGTTMMGDAHRLWLGLKDVMTSGDEAILEECIRVEEHFIEDYEEVLRNEIALPKGIINLIQEQLEKGKISLENLIKLKEIKE